MGKWKRLFCSELEDTVQVAVRQARRLIVAVVGGTVVLAGVVMLVTPGPAMVVIPAGLAILAAEFAWARRLLKRVKREVGERIGGLTGERAKAALHEGGPEDDSMQEESSTSSGQGAS